MAAVNNNSSTVVVGRTSPVPAGQQVSAKSIPVVIASDQSPIPVEEQNKQQSEVALSLLGIPRSEVALGIFADVNTYDVNPSEWSAYPEQFTNSFQYSASGLLHENLGGSEDWGLTHIPEEAGAMIEAPSDEYSILTSKRFFRYQPGRVSAATFGVKLNRSPYTITDGASNGDAIRNPSIKKYGIFDKFDGYYYETKNDGYGDNFCVVRRTQSIIRENPLPFNALNTGQQEDYDWVGIPLVESTASTYPNASEILKANKRFLQEVAVVADNNAFDGPDAGSGGSASQGSEDAKCRRDAGLIIEGLIHDLKYGGNATTVYNTLRFFNKTDPDNIQLFIDDSSREVARYNLIKTHIVSLLGGTGVTAVNGFSSYEAGSVASLPGTASIETGATTQVGYLLDILTTALTGTGNYTSIPTPVGSAAGEMCVYRDGLVMTHAAAHDPSLLKEKTNYDITALVEHNSNVYIKLKVPSQKDALQVGQGVYFNKNGNTTNNILPSTNVEADALKDGSIMYVYEVNNVITDANGIYQEVRLSANPANEEIYTTVGGGDTAKASNPWGSGKAYLDPGIFDITQTGIGDISGYGFTLQTPVPFVLPGDTKQYSGNNYTDASLIAASPQFADGSFPYLYPSGGSADPNSRGYIDSTLDGSAGISLIKQQFNYVNKRLFKNWIWFNVDPKYYKVYEYRVPRSRMSGEKLNGRTTEVVYSDNVLDAKAGDPVLEPATGEQIEVDSVWDLDPTKVTMYKIEFSWYGAVGATFLAYVPVSNNEARWVRVHHLRASNQLKVASLGNATLPITYMVYGGGSENRYGYKNSDRQSNIASGYGSYSEQLVKYGASYYIDGGDRGTVRLFSHASDALKEIGGSKYLIVAGDNSDLFTNSGANQESTIGAAYVNAPYLEIGTLNNAPAISDYYINAKVITSDLNDQDVRVVFADGDKLYLSRPLSATTGNISLIVDRPQPLLGLKCRREINGIRNRVQIYPSRLSTGLTSSSESLVVQLIKSPIFQTLDVPNSGVSISLNQQVNIGKRGKKVLLQPSKITETGGSYLDAGEKTYGYFRYTIVGDTSGTAYTTLGLLERTIDGYYFSAAEVTVDELNIVGKFLRAGHYSGPGDNSNNPNLSSTVEAAGFTGFSSSQLSRLSAVNIDTEQRSPIPGTGTVITTLFSPNSGEEYDLQTYFDYNKDYLSFPLTDLVDSLYVCASSKSFYNGTDGTGTYDSKGNILASLTWEEQ